MHTLHAGTFAINARGVAEGCDCQPLRRADKTTKRIGLVARVLSNSGERRRVQGLSEQGAYAADDSRERAVHRPRCRAWTEISGVHPMGELAHPLRLAIRIARDDAAEPGSDEFLGGCEHIHLYSMPRDGVDRDFKSGPTADKGEPRSVMGG
ncbi:unannotated protein [freshwater metagenome]|uniref:Unannotated protein n=1 Tax=freshwater metagenome TaxID=449393 RepID=A0A6J7H7H1_9ZZZZ